MGRPSTFALIPLVFVATACSNDRRSPAHPEPSPNSPGSLWADAGSNTTGDASSMPLDGQSVNDATSSRDGSSTDGRSDESDRDGGSSERDAGGEVIIPLTFDEYCS